MKKISCILLSASIFCACQKVPDEIITVPLPTTCRLSKMLQGLAAHTVYQFKYDDKGRLASITDSTYNDVYKCSYDAADRLVKYSNEIFLFTAEYNSGGLPSKIITEILGDPYPFAGSEYTYEYNAAKQPVKRTEYRFDDGKLKPLEAKTYEFSNGDIVRTSSHGIDPLFDTTKTYVTEYTYYTFIPNVFKSLSFFGATYTALGFYDLLDIDFYFNKHLFKSSTVVTQGTGDASYTQTYTLNPLDSAVISSKAVETHDGQVTAKYTRSFFYDCK